MLTHYLKIALRHLSRHKATSFINIFGLAIGMACAVLIFLWVQQQLSYDRWQPNKDRIYRLENETWVVMPPYLRETAAVFPETEHAVRFYFWYEPTLKYRENIFTVTDFALVDSTVFEVFEFNFIEGNPLTALKNPFSVVLTESISKRLFGIERPIGKVVRMSNEYDYTVTGVVEDIDRFHMDINAFASVNDVTRMSGNDDFLTSRNYNFSIYLLVDQNASIAGLSDKINDRASEVDNYGGDRLILRPFTEIYFANHLQHEKNTKHGNINLVVVFSIIAILILVIACINFINLTIAETTTREREIAVRKVSGARRFTIQSQFFGETFLLVIVSFVFSLILIRLFIPSFNNLTGESISMIPMSTDLVIIIGGVLLFTSFLSGMYPSFYLSSVKPSLILKGTSGKGRRSSVLSKSLIAFQFAVSIFLIISAITVIKQLDYMQNSDLGLNHDQVLTVTLRGDRFQGEPEQLLNSKRAFEDRLLAHANIRGVTYLNQLPGKITNTWSWYVTDPEQTIPIKVINADPGFVDLMEIDILEGRNFSYDIPTDLDRKYLLNEEAVRQLGLKDPVGSANNGGRSTIIGVIRDFHYNSLHTSIEPLAIEWRTGTTRACIKLSGNTIEQSIRHVENVYAEFCPGFAFEYEFLETSFAAQYAAEKRLEKILAYFVALAICLSCLGLFALSAFIARQRTKEIGIRKVLGSSVSGIVLLLTKTFAGWILVANLVSWPVAYLVLRSWLNEFAYHINVGYAVFLISTALAFSLALATVVYQALRAATVNPVKSLRYE